MMNIGEIFEKNGIKVENFEDKEVEVKQENEELVFWNKYLKLLERKASPKEMHQFAIANGFLSPKHLETYTRFKDVCDSKEEELLLLIESKEYLKERKVLIELKSQCESIRNPYGYRLYLRAMKKKDITPYGEDVLKMDLHHENDSYYFRGSF